MQTNVFVFGILITAPLALWGALCAINAVSMTDTRKSIAAAFLCIAWGWGALIFAALDYLLHEYPLFWPRVLLLGVLCLSVGNSLLYLANRRECRCLGCPPKKKAHPLMKGRPA